MEYGISLKSLKPLTGIDYEKTLVMGTFFKVVDRTCIEVQNGCIKMSCIAMFGSPIHKVGQLRFLLVPNHQTTLTNILILGFKVSNQFQISPPIFKVSSLRCLRSIFTLIPHAGSCHTIIGKKIEHTPSKQMYIELEAFD